VDTIERIVARLERVADRYRNAQDGDGERRARECAEAVRAASSLAEARALEAAFMLMASGASQARRVFAGAGEYGGGPDPGGPIVAPNPDFPGTWGNPTPPPHDPTPPPHDPTPPPHDPTPPEPPHDPTPPPHDPTPPEPPHDPTPPSHEPHVPVHDPGDHDHPTPPAHPPAPPTPPTPPAQPPAPTAIGAALGQAVAQKANSVAANYRTRNVKYSPGGNAANGGTTSDCSHFVNDVLKQSGIDAPYATAQPSEIAIAQSPAFEKVTGAPQPGDIIVQGNHMGVYQRHEQGHPVGTQMGDHHISEAPWGPGGWFGNAPVEYYRPKK
jgi:NlpC/P60 family